MKAPKGDSGNGHYADLARTSFVVVILVSLTPLLLVSAITVHQFHKAYREKVLAHLEVVVNEHKQSIDNFLKEKLADIRVLAASTPLEELSDDDTLKRLLRILQEEHQGAFVDLGLVNGEGIQVAYAGPFSLGKANYADSSWFKEAMQSRYYVSDVFLGLRGLPHFIVAVRCDCWGGKDWILRSTLDFVAFNRLVESVRIDETGMAFIINRKGEFQTKPRVDLSAEVQQVLALGDRQVKRSSPKSEPTAGYLEWSPIDSDQPSSGNGVHAFNIKNPSGTELIYVLSPLKNGDWTLAYRQEVGDAFADLYHTRNIAVITVVIGTLLIVLTALVVSRAMRSRLVEAGREKELMNEQVIEAGKLASLGELAAGIAHEINNPVAIMVEEAGWIGDLLDDVKAEGNGHMGDLSEFERSLKQIRTQGARCKDITHKLLSFARGSDSRLQEVDVNDLISEVVGLSGHRAKYGNVTIETRLSPGLPIISASPSELQQVLLNLMNNAIDAMSKKGGVLEIVTQRENGQLELSVSDTGEGIAKANLARIFDPFFTTKPVGKGTGLGLSICYGIIKKMGGNITVRSALDVGTTFSIRLPLRPEAAEAAGQTPEDTESLTGGA